MSRVSIRSEVRHEVETFASVQADMRALEEVWRHRFRQRMAELIAREGLTAAELEMVTGALEDKE